jgi:hypothetical protein
VIYLPNCGASSDTLVDDVRSALLVAFGDEKSSLVREKIERLQTTEQLSAFCKSLPSKSLIFVLDQFNGVQDDSAGTLYRGSQQEFARNYLKQVRKQCTWHFISMLSLDQRLVTHLVAVDSCLMDQISSSHVSVLGYSANNYTARILATKQRNEFDLFIYGGFTEV